MRSMRITGAQAAPVRNRTPTAEHRPHGYAFYAGLSLVLIPPPAMDELGSGSQADGSHGIKHLR